METLSSIFNFFKKEVTSFLRNIFAVLRNFMGNISVHASGLLALQKRIFLQNTQQKSTAHIKGWGLKFSFPSLILALSTLLTGANGWGQSYATLGTGGAGAQYSTSWTNPYRHGWTDFRGQYIFTAAELTSAGLSAGSQISAISFYVRTKNSTGSIENFTISLAHTSTSNFSSAFLAPSFTTCYTGNVTTVANSWNTHTFTTNFTWDGTSNIIVQSCFDDNSYSSSDEYYYQITSDNVHYNYADGASGCSMANYSDDTWRPVTRFTYTNCTPASTYYSKSSGNLDVLSSWGTNANGSGTAPCNFTNASTTYYIANRTTATIGANWTVSGAGSKVVLGQASAAAVTFTVPSGFSFTGTIDVPAALSGSNTLVLNNTTVPTLGTLHSGSTVKYNATGSQTIQATTYGNLETGVESGTSNSTKTVAASGTLSIAGNLTINDYSTFNLNDRDMTLTGDFIRSSTASPTTSLFSHGSGTSNTVTFNGSSQEVNVTAANGTTPTNGDITFNHVTIDGASVKLFYFKTNDRKLNINNFTVNSGKVVTLYSNPQPL